MEIFTTEARTQRRKFTAEDAEERRGKHTRNWLC